MDILILSDIHANFPALEAVTQRFPMKDFDHIIHCGDALVFGPYPNETLQYLHENKVLSILGNTDNKVLMLLDGKSFKKPRKKEKRSMYFWTKDNLTKSSVSYLRSLPSTAVLQIPGDHSDPLDDLSSTVGVYHGSPFDPDEFLFDTTPDSRFVELAASVNHQIIAVGHSHTPFHKKIGSTHFLNPGSVGRMFDGCNYASCITMHIDKDDLRVAHHRVPYNLDKLLEKLKEENFPPIYSKMYTLGKKLN